MANTIMMTEETKKKMSIAQKNSYTTLMTKRVSYLNDRLKNGGRGLTWPELKEEALQKVPGGNGLDEKLIKRIAYGLDQKIDVSTPEKAQAVQLPWARKMTVWEEQREKNRRNFIIHKKARAKYNQKQELKKKNPTVAVTEVQATPEHVLKTSKDLPTQFKEHLDGLKQVMQALQYRRLELVIADNDLRAIFEPMPKTEIFML